jgi:OPT family oligopeptide transporter
MARRLSEDTEGLRDIELDDSSYSYSIDGVDEASDDGEAAEDSIDTPRMWTLSILFAILGSSLNLFFSLRYPSISISPILALLVSHPLGLFWDAVFKEVEDVPAPVASGSPTEEESLLTEHESLSQSRFVAGPTIARTWKGWLAQGRWNCKEHCCVFIASSVSFGFAFATDVSVQRLLCRLTCQVIVEQSKFYGQHVSITYQILLTLSTQILGYALAGLTRSFLVRPGGMVWPQTLAAKAMLTSLHKNENRIANGWKVSRFRFFLYVFLGSTAFYFLPGLLFPALSYFNVVTWIAPQNVVLANLFGVSSGLGLFPLTFDWSQISFVGSPLITPFWAALNVFGGLFVVIWIFAPILCMCPFIMLWLTFRLLQHYVFFFHAYFVIDCV